MPWNQSVTTYFALNAANDTSPSGLTDIITGQPIYIPDLDLGVYFDLTTAEAAQLSQTSVRTLNSGRYRRIKVDSGATAANVKTGTIGIMPSLAVVGNTTPECNVVTSYDQGIGNATTVRPVVFLNAITPGNYGFVQELGIATVLGKTGLTNATPKIGDVIISSTSGLVDDPTQTTQPTYAQMYAILGVAIDLPLSNALFRIMLDSVPVLQD